MLRPPVSTPNGHSERFTTPALGEVHLRTVHYGGDPASTLVLLHGGGGNAHWWDHLAPQLAEQRRVVALDFRGHGDSDYPDDLERGAFDRDLEGLLEHLGVSDPALFGHSMGAHVAVRFAAAHPSTRALIALEISRGATRRDRRFARLALAARRTYRSRDEALRRYRFLPDAPGASEGLRLHIAKHSVRQEADGRFGFKFDARWFGLPASPPVDLATVACPTLIVRGSRSTLLPAEGAASLAEKIPDTRVIEIEGGGHNVHLERPAEVLQAVEGFLSGLP